MSISQGETSNKSDELKSYENIDEAKGDMKSQTQKRNEEYCNWFLNHSKIDSKEMQNTNEIDENFELNFNRIDIRDYSDWFQRHCTKKLNDKKENEDNNENNETEKNKKIEYDHGEYYIGEVCNNKRNGKGIVYYKNGNIKYEGDFINDKYEGEGKYIWEDGNYYIGQWKSNLRNGNGILYNKNCDIIYNGNWTNDKH